MRNLILDLKIKRELKRFKKFKDNYEFKIKQLDERDDGSVYCDGVCLRENSDAEWLGESETFVNVGYKLHGEFSKVFSNLFPYKFYFKGYRISSIEAIFQAFKFKDKKMQKLVFDYDGINSNRIKACSNYDWKKTQTMYFLGKILRRDSKEYEDFIDELYVSALMNPLFKNALKNVKDKYILHSMGEKDMFKTTFSRQEFERELNLLKDYVQSQDNKN